jgi:hypothetical protein
LELLSTFTFDLFWLLREVVLGLPLLGLVVEITVGFLLLIGVVLFKDKLLDLFTSFSQALILFMEFVIIFVSFKSCKDSELLFVDIFYLFISFIYIFYINV